MRRAAPALALALAACATASLPPVTAPGFVPEDEEKAIWREAAEEQHRLDTSGDVFEDAALEAYLMAVARRIVPPAAFKAVPFRIRVLRNFRLNAFALPNGAVYVHTGMLARMDSEAELAVLLGHEMTHATHRHAVREQRQASNWASAWAGISTATLGLASPIGGLAAGAAIRGYGRDMEREADQNGLALVAAAGYDVGEAPKLFRHLEEWVKSEEDEEPFYFGSHPRLDERIESCEQLVATVYKDKRGGSQGAEAFRQKTSRVLLANARLNLEAGRLDAARRDAEKHIAIDKAGAGGHSVLGEVARRTGPESFDLAVVQYRLALQADPRLAEAHRGLGLVLWKKGERKGARAALARYLELEPNAPDRAHVREYLRSGE